MEADAAEGAWEGGTGDLVDLDPVRPLKTLARPPEPLASGDWAASPGEGDMGSGLSEAGGRLNEAIRRNILASCPPRLNCSRLDE